MVKVSNKSAGRKDCAEEGKNGRKERGVKDGGREGGRKKSRRKE